MRITLFIASIILLVFGVFCFAAGVLSMILSFQSIANSVETPKPVDLANGISNGMLWMLAGKLAFIFSLVTGVIGLCSPKPTTTNL